MVLLEKASKSGKVWFRLFCNMFIDTPAKHTGKLPRGHMLGSFSTTTATGQTIQLREKGLLVPRPLCSALRVGV